MYFSKKYLVNLYSKMAKIYPRADIEKQGGTQFVSELKYFFAVDEFVKKFSRECDTQNKSDRDYFIKCVGSMVFLSKGDDGLFFSTTNFAKSIVKSKDYNVGSNFFSVNVVKTSLYSDERISFPQRHPALLFVHRGKLGVDSQGYRNLAESGEYLGGVQYKYALMFVWLNRYCDFRSVKEFYEDGLKYLINKYSSNMVECLQWKDNKVREQIEDLVKNADTESSLTYLLQSDLIAVEADIMPLSAVRKNLSSYNLIVFGAPGTGKSFRLNKDAKNNFGDDDIERITFHPAYTYAQFVGCYKPVAICENRIIDDETSQDFQILKNKDLSVQEKYDLLYEKHKDNEMRLVLPTLVGLFADGEIKARVSEDTQKMPLYNGGIGRKLRKYVGLDSKINGGISYEYVPGPFIRIYQKAKKEWERAKKENRKPAEFLLIIEEINRANAPAVFGDIFQSLDRDENGESIYEVATSEDLRKYLDDHNVPNPEIIKIPSNMHIWATMNSADQGVQPLDTAFKRRWEMEYIDLDGKSEDGEGNAEAGRLAQCMIPAGGIKEQNPSTTWGRFRDELNKFLLKECKVREDKCIGPFFIKSGVIENANDSGDGEKEFRKQFKSKLLMYLYEDVVKMNPKNLFKEDCCVTYSALRQKYDEIGLKIFKFDVSQNIEDGGAPEQT